MTRLEKAKMKKWPKEKIYGLRKALNETQELFAARFGLTNGAIWHWENGTRKPEFLALRELDRIEQGLRDGSIVPREKKRELQETA